MRLYASCVYIFLYFPIGIIVLFSFNAGRHASQLQGFSTQWYGKALSNPFVMDALQTSLLVAFTSALLASLFGTMAAVALQGIKGPVRTVFDMLIYVAVMIPGIVIGIATLIGLVTVFDQLNPVLASIWPGDGTPPKLNMGLGSLVAAHTMFLMALVIIIVRARLSGMDRALTEASSDLYATPFGTFRQVTLPLIFPAVLAGFLLSFTFSFDDFIIAFFVAGSETTLPIYVFSSIRRGVTPEINAIGTMVLAVSLVMLVAAQILLRRGEKKSK
ncbi:ABC transporter permease [Pseudohalocynthiibacter aestuariivivens]|jgi:spermidine/putrescine transport system permease protein|uniref:ABC transporter permease n=1 Tax=Pseudohalocynthiibacter aestuariivivens TaxID=1591409 RepID=A0ABV5JJ60_9RHOB|nr:MULTISPECIES: ABC transporter permease [Pseudohalocynthiibacter]MBS9718434.1 ABC transporter permease [Pseudohalocynthiibacter aestuariivivens]MCK0104099.1 ABC transporter permease [Pseudohalocynthiibacter sp. F2068]